MSIDSVRRFFATKAPDIAIIETDASSATVPEAAAAHGVAPGQIAKTLTLKVGDRICLLVTAGDARLDNRKVKAALGGRTRMLDLSEVEAVTGHPVGGVCPFGLARPLDIYCDITLKAWREVVPAAGSTNSAVFISPDRMVELVGANWVDCCESRS